ncbi:MAG: BamA/TamA family outer membrane protein [Oscillatoriales cyanobacterium RM2_1_1]|nr:BamA/TamA family outer membrane protein [Oscillatoriales cyanobacterium SM2_3_0]NJO44520.1 BamA/TamA family outer membrane protein [Oscillatoriales cyanobacterium RM2_1_1]
MGGFSPTLLPLQKSEGQKPATPSILGNIVLGEYHVKLQPPASTAFPTEIVLNKSRSSLEPAVELSLNKSTLQKSFLSPDQASPGQGKNQSLKYLNLKQSAKPGNASETQVASSSKVKQIPGKLAFNPPAFELSTADDLIALNKLDLDKSDLFKSDFNQLASGSPGLNTSLNQGGAASLGELLVQAEPQPAETTPDVNPQEALPNLNPENNLPNVNPQNPGPPIEAQPGVPNLDSPDTVPSLQQPGSEGSPELPPDLSPERPIPGTGVPVPTPSQQSAPEPEVLVAEVVVAGAINPEVEARVYEAISTRPGLTTTRTQLQRDINAIFSIGLFRNVRAVPEDTPLGVRVTFVVEPNPTLQAVVVEGDQVLPQEVIDQAFAGQVGKTIDLNQVGDAIETINTWYQENGYVLAQIVAAPEVTPEGTITLTVAEGVIENIRVRYLNRDGEATDEEGQPIEGNTREFIITREIELKPGDVFNQRKAQQDLARVFGLGIFEDVRLELEPGNEDPSEAIVIVNVIERSTGSLALGGGISSATGLFGTVSYQEQNLGGNNQRLGAEVQLGEDILLLDLSFTDPWIAGDPYRTSYTVNIFRRRAISLIFEEGQDEDKDVRLPNGDRVRIIRTGGGITFTRPFAETPYVDPDFVTSLGLQYQRVEAADAESGITPRDDAGKLLTASESGQDDLITLQFGIAQDRRNNTIFPTSGYTFRVGTEQSIPVGSGSIFYNRVRGSYNFFLPVDILDFIPDAPEALAFSIQAGTILGDFPPYEAFPLGGASTVRGWREGALGVARSFVLGSVEYRFPIFSVGNFLIGGALFVDAATALGTQSTVPGNPGGIRGKPGSGLGFGAGLRVQSPLGPIRIDYGINNLGEGRIHFGIGERF